MIFHWTGVKLTVWSQVGSWTPSQQRSTSSQITPGTSNNKFSFNCLLSTITKSRKHSWIQGIPVEIQMEVGGVGPGETQHDIVTAPHPLHILIISCPFPVVTCSLLTHKWHQTSYSCILWSISLNNTFRTTERLLIRISEAGFAYSSTVRLVNPCWTSSIQIDSNWVNVNLSKVPVQVDISVTERVGLWNSQVSVWIALKIGL